MADFSLKAVFGMDSTGFKTEIKQLRKEMNSFVADWAKIGVAAAAGAFAALSKGAIDLASKLSDASLSIGINVTSLQALVAQHKLNGVSEEKLTVALGKTRKAVIEAAGGNEDMQRSLRGLGLSAETLIRLPLDKQYEAIARAMVKATDQNLAYSSVAKILGEEVGPKLIGSLKELGEQGLPKVTKSAEEAGKIMSTSTIVALERAGDAIEAFKTRATVAVGNILVNFRTEEGLKLLGMQLLKVLGMFGAGVADAVVDSGMLFFSVFKGATRGVANVFKDFMIDAVQGAAYLINKVLPKSFAIDVSNLDDFRSNGESIALTIQKAISDTSPSTFRKDIGEWWDRTIADQQGVVDKLNKVDLVKDTKKLDDAGKAVKVGIQDGAKSIADAGKEAAKEIKEAARSMTIARVGQSYQEQSTTALQGVRARVQGNLSSAQAEDFVRPGSVGGMAGQESAATAFYKSELINIDKELAARADFAKYFQMFGEKKALETYGDSDFARFTREMQDTNTRSVNAIENINRNLADLFNKPTR